MSALRRGLAATAFAVASLVVVGAPLAAATAPRATALPCLVTVSNQLPAQRTTILVYVHSAAKSRVAIAVHFRTHVTRRATTANRYGAAAFSIGIGAATRHFKVPVNAVVTLGSSRSSCQTWFTPR